MRPIDIVITDRQHLVDITRILVDGIAPEFLFNTQKPVIFDVAGTLGSGKKIISDAGVEKIFNIWNARRTYLYSHFTRNPKLTGKKGCDEIWSGFYRKQPIEIAFLDAACGGGFSRKEIEEGICQDHFFPEVTPEERWNQKTMRRTQNFLKLRKHGGITFIQNCDQYKVHDPWISLWVEYRYAPLVGTTSRRISDEAHESLRTIFQSKASDAESKWVRFIRVEAKNPALLASGQFQRALSRLESQSPLFGAVSVRPV